VALASILAQDRVGVVSEVADHLFEASVNLGDNTFAVLGPGTEFTAVCELLDGPWISPLFQTGRTPVQSEPPQLGPSGAGWPRLAARLSCCPHGQPAETGSVFP
jgi:hypothetical protein